MLAAASLVVAGMPGARADTKTIRFDLRPKTTAKLKTRVDQHRVLVVIRPAPAEVALQLDPQLSAKLEAHIRKTPNDGVEIVLTSGLLVESARLHQSTRLLRVELDLSSGVRAVRGRVRRPLPAQMPSQFIAKLFRPAERAMRAGSYARARRLFEGLTDEFATEAWARLRLADLELITNDERRACAAYQNVYEQFGTRTSGLLARMRLYVLRCPDATVHSLRLADALGQLRRLDGVIGRFLWAEVIWGLTVMGRLDDTDFVLAHVPAYIRGGTSQIARHVLINNVVYGATEPFAAAKFLNRFAKELPRHPEGADLLLAGARALMALDLPQQTIAVLRAPWAARLWRGKRARGALWRERVGEGQVLVLLAQAYRALGDRAKHDEMVADYRARFKSVAPVPPAVRSDFGRGDLEVARALDDLQFRVRAAQNAVNATVRATSTARSNPTTGRAKR